MSILHSGRNRNSTNHNLKGKVSIFQRLHVDPLLLFSILALMGAGLFVLISAANRELGMLDRQLIRFGVALGAMLIVAQIPPRYFRIAVPALFGVGTLLLIMVLIFGTVGGGAQRWLDLKLIRFQPSELMKLVVPMMVAFYFSKRPLPCTFKDVIISLVIIIIPVLLVAKQPDLGTALLIAASGLFVLFLAGLPWRYIIGMVVTAMIAAPALWMVMRDYQKKRVLTFLNPENDPLGAGYHIIQSKIAIGSGGFWGKGWFEGTQSHLEFLPERSTDFIFAVLAEEFGLVGVIVLLGLYSLIILRAAAISMQAQSTFTRLLAGSITLTFGIYVIINIGMVSGVFPVVGIPLPLVSYGGTSIVTLLLGFGILMSISTHRQLVSD
jgi:rod shape determining protein RodA